MSNHFRLAHNLGQKSAYKCTFGGTTTYHGLIDRYGGDEALIELCNLLCSWNLGNLYDFFKQQNLYVGVLKKLSRTMAENLFQNTDVCLGARVEFVFQWSQWMKSFDQCTQKQSNTKSSTSRLTLQSNDLVVNEANLQGPQPTSSQIPDVKQLINLEKIINSNSFGKSVVETYKKNNSMNENLRKLLIESILQYCITNNYELSVADCASLASQIGQVFPGELESYYYLERKNAAPMGKLYNKFRNWKTNFNRKTNESEGSSKKPKNKTFSIAGDEEEHIQALKYDYLSMTYEEKMSHWSACAATRMNSIREQSQLIFEAWPQYKSPDGFRLIESDFNFLFGARNEVLHNLANFCNLMIEKVFPVRFKQCKEDNDICLLNELVQGKGSLSEDSICCTVFHLMHSLLPRSQISKKSTQKLTDKKRFYSVKESQNSFMAVCATEAEYKQMYDTKVKTELSVPPFISLIGTLKEPQSFMVDFENITYKFFSFSKAMDVCFKAYNVFNIVYAEPCDPMWEFINRYFYNLPTIGKPKPAMDILLQEIKLAKES